MFQSKPMSLSGKFLHEKCCHPESFWFFSDSSGNMSLLLGLFRVIMQHVLLHNYDNFFTVGKIHRHLLHHDHSHWPHCCCHTGEETWGRHNARQGATTTKPCNHIIIIMINIAIVMIIKIIIVIILQDKTSSGTLLAFLKKCWTRKKTQKCVFFVIL